MGFCRRCGDIVVGPRCKCGGTAVAPVVKWPDGSDEPIQDRWSKTYVTKPEPSTTRTPEAASSASMASGPTSGRRFPRPAVNTSMNSRISAHIASATASRPASPLKQSSTFSQPTEAKAEEGILPSPHGSELAKVYGSVLQPKETLASYACALCAEVFHPDATVYPDPLASFYSDDTTRFLCRPCFITNGGSKGDCPTCKRPVLILKSEGGFVESVGRVWHKKCFVCDGCGKNIGDRPMVDLLSRPCCPDCFDTCLTRPVNSSKASTPGDKNDRLSGSRRDEPSRESSPTLGELEKRLGISRTPTKPSADSVYGSPSTYDAKPRALPGLSSSTPDRVKYFSPTTSPSYTRYKSPEPDDPTDRGSPGFTRYSQTRLKSPELEEESPSTRRTYRHRSPASAHESLTDSPSGARSSPRTSIQPTEQAIEEMKRRFLSGSPMVTPTKPTPSSNSSTPRRKRSKSRSRSRPRASDTSVASSTSADDSARKHRTLRSTASTSSLRSALRAQRTGEEELDSDILYPDRTGESTRPLRIRRNRTGDSQTTVQEDVTGGTSYLTGTIRPQRTAEPVYGVDALERQTSSLIVQPQKTGDTDYTMLASQVTGDTAYTKAVARQRTGDGIGSQHTGYAIYPPLRPQKTGERSKSKSSRRESNEVVDKLITNRTGDAEVESLLGSFSDDLIDLSGRVSSTSTLPSSRSTGSMSKIPQLSGIKGFPARRSPRTSTATSSEGYESSVSSTPDLAGDFSDTTSAISSGPSTPPSLSPPPRSTPSKSDFWSSKTSSGRNGPRDNAITPMGKSRTLPMNITIPEHMPSDARCEKCRELLFSVKHGGKFVTVPEEPTSTGALPKRYHTACFRCKICDEVFEEREGGHAVFVRVEEGACHVRCAPPEKITLRKVPTTVTVIPKLSSSSGSNAHTNIAGSGNASSATSTAYYTSSSRYERPLPTAPAQTTTFAAQPRFGGSAACPGCHKAVSPMERGVVPGPQSTRWHASCLVCGGERAKGRRKEDGKPGCGKKLDSAAKSDAEGGVWCRECLLLLPAELRQVRSPIVPTATGGRPTSVVAPQYTGTTTLARQFTGLGLGSSSEAALPRHATGGGYSPTKQTIKLHDGPRPGHVYPRPKSVTGTRSTGGEGRGMFLVRQLTGGNSSFKGGDYGL